MPGRVHQHLQYGKGLSCGHTLLASQTTMQLSQVTSSTNQQARFPEHVFSVPDSDMHNCIQSLISCCPTVGAVTSCCPTVGAVTACQLLLTLILCIGCAGLETTADTAAELGPDRVQIIVDNLGGDKTAALAKKLGGSQTGQLVTDMGPGVSGALATVLVI